MIYPVMPAAVQFSLTKGGFRKSPSFKSLVQRSATDAITALALKAFATWTFEVDLYAVIGGPATAGSVVQLMLGVFLQCRGQAGRFVFTDANDCTVAPEAGQLVNVTPGAANPMSNVADGISTVYQFARSIDIGLDILQTVTGYTVLVDGVETAVTVDTAGKATFANPPAAGSTLTWFGTFAYLCKFSDDTMGDLGMFSKNASGFLWQASSIKFESVFVQ